MSVSHNCDRDLVRFVTGTSEADGQEGALLDGIRSCPRCRAVVTHAATALDAPAVVNVPPIGPVTEAVTARLQSRWRIRTAVSFFVVGTLSLLILGLSFRVDDAFARVRLGAWGAAFFVLWFLGVVDVRRDKRLSRLFARLQSGHFNQLYSDGRMVNGVCFGVSEYLGLWPEAVRPFMLVALVWFPMEAACFYFLLSGALHVHPADRHLMYRYRLVRFWEQWRLKVSTEFTSRFARNR
jgi:phage shock protein PspC (stress-responsive transcriptional regulator)